jgi:PKD repeat protein
VNSKVILSLFFTLFLIFILSSCPVAPLTSQNVCINEFELNPKGNDNCTCTEEWAELYNPTSNNISIGGWTVTTIHGKSVTIPVGTIIATQGFYVVSRYGNGSAGSEWLVNENESIILTEAYGTEIDRTPVKSDLCDNASTWQRVPDGSDNWVFQPSTRGGFNTNQPPKADFSFYPLNPKWGENIQFTDLSKDIDGYIIRWHWDFGDGQTSNETNPNHSYAHGGLYVVNLTVEDNGTATDTKQEFIVVKKSATQLEIVLLPTSIKVGQSFNITAILKDELNSTLEGEKVNFYVDEEKIASNITNSEGVASVTYTATKPGLVLVKTSYSGSPQYNASTKEASLTILGEKLDWTPYILGGTATGIILGSIILTVRYRMKKKSQESEPHIQATDEENQA